jgi:DNA-binding transcriptional LysR family regulator
MDRITATRVFVTIAQLGSLTRAADSLDMSRAMVTRHLQAMEDWVGVRLFHRNTRRLSLTPAGERTLACSRDLLGLAEQLPWPARTARPRCAACCGWPAPPRWRTPR